MIKLLIFGSPCTFWSIAQKNNRETTASGIGWELFKNCLIAKEKFQPDFFLYENNVSAAPEIKAQIKQEFHVATKLLAKPTDARYIEINSALVSAQNRQRFYVHNCGNVTQPKDRHIYLKDILESGYGFSGNNKSFCLTASYNGACAWNTLERAQREMVAEPIQVGVMPRPNGELSTSAGMRIYSVDGKGRCLIANGGGQGAKTGLYAEPVIIQREREAQIKVA